MYKKNIQLCGFLTGKIRVEWFEMVELRRGGLIYRDFMNALAF
jgi:hypothetical protein